VWWRLREQLCGGAYREIACSTMSSGLRLVCTPPKELKETTGDAFTDEFADVNTEREFDEYDGLRSTMQDRLSLTGLRFLRQKKLGLPSFLLSRAKHLSASFGGLLVHSFYAVS
jgi:hypothetical protein